MTILLFVIILLISAISAASFAADRNRSQPGWFIAGILFGPVGLFVLLLLPVSDKPWKPGRARRIILVSLAVVLVVLALTSAVMEVYSGFASDLRTHNLHQWTLYGASLLRVASARDYAPDSYPVVAARRQVIANGDSLRRELLLTQDDLDLTTQGLRRAVGARAVLSNVVRVVTFRKPRWPALVSLPPREQERVLDSLEQQRTRYLEYISVIDSARAQWPPLPPTR